MSLKSTLNKFRNPTEDNSMYDDKKP